MQTDTGSFRALGAMSGSSLDGLDLALCAFTHTEGHWAFRVEKAITIPYSSSMRERLLLSMTGTGLELARAHRDLGQFIGEAAKDFLQDDRIDLVASHGHTIFHKPEEGLTTQIACGARIAALTNTMTVCDFRTKDIALGGQGAPLVPIGERELFPSHQAFLNLGGISNIAVHKHGSVAGYDIGPCNQALNLIAGETGRPYDAEGALARSGKLIEPMLEQLNALPFYQQTPPRSVGREWFDEHMRPIISSTTARVSDRMRTAAEHCAQMIAHELARQQVPSVLVTGGGAHNAFLIERIQALSTVRIEIPERTIVDFKEAIIFAFLGVLRVTEKPNALASVTGASRDSVGGAVYLPN